MEDENKIVKRKVSMADLFLSGELRNYIITKNGLMTWEDWYNKPHPSANKIEDADFEIIEPKQIENKTNNNGTDIK